jgi:riboflavin-specific deaminase-like protein
MAMAAGDPVHGAARLGETQAWRLILAARSAVDAGITGGELPFTILRDTVVCGANGAGTVLVDRSAGCLGSGHERFDQGACRLLEQFLALALVAREAGLVCGVLGQTLDGYIATHDGESRYINGSAGLAHLHRLRALSDAVMIGASTAALDHPRLTTRHVEGPNAVRVVIDPRGRLPADSPLLRDDAAPTLVLRPGTGPERRLAEHARVVPLGECGVSIEPARILAALRERGLCRVLIEGGGNTVSRFLAADRLDRLQLLVAPVILGAGRPAVSLPPVERLSAALRPLCRRYLLAEDVLFDLHFRLTPSPLATQSTDALDLRPSNGEEGVP